MMRVRMAAWAASVSAAILTAGSGVHAHSGPPFPIVSDQVAGAYRIAVWADPDATDDGSAGGQFWVTIAMADGGAVPADTTARVTIAPADRPGSAHSGRTGPVDDDVARQFVALLMDHEGPFSVRVEIAGARGPAAVQASVDATYDVRPPPAMLVVYLLPFVLVGFLWLKLLVRRRRIRGEAKT